MGTTIYLHSGKLSCFVTKREFCGENFRGFCSTPIILWVRPQSFADKTFTDGSETARNATVFSFVRQLFRCTAYCAVRRCSAVRRIALYGVLRCTVYCAVRRIALYGILRCTAYCAVRRIALYGVLRCTAYCAVRRIALYGVLRCTAYCAVRRIALYGGVALCGVLRCTAV